VLVRGTVNSFSVCQGKVLLKYMYKIMYINSNLTYLIKWVKPFNINLLAVFGNRLDLRKWIDTIANLIDVKKKSKNILQKKK
jgi:hypothetical protein